jgi:hypothetical protein
MFSDNLYFVSVSVQELKPADIKTIKTENLVHINIGFAEQSKLNKV